MDILEVELWREALHYGHENLPDLNYPDVQASEFVQNTIVLAFVKGYRYATDNTQRLDP